MLTRKMQGDSMLFYDGDSLILTIVEEEIDNGILMTFKGNLRSDTAHHIQDELDAFTTVGIKVTIDFKDVSFISASTLLAMLNAQQLIDFFRKGEIVLRNIPDSVYKEMDETGITELLMIED